jgi:hypothetical protein
MTWLIVILLMIISIIISILFKIYKNNFIKISKENIPSNSKLLLISICLVFFNSLVAIFSKNFIWFIVIELNNFISIMITWGLKNFIIIPWLEIIATITYMVTIIWIPYIILIFITKNFTNTIDAKKIVNQTFKIILLSMLIFIIIITIIVFILTLLMKNNF